MNTYYISLELQFAGTVVRVDAGPIRWSESVGDVQLGNTTTQPTQNN